MATAKQRIASRKNIRKARIKWRGMSRREHSFAQPEGRGRKRPGVGGGGNFYRIEVRPRSDFVTFRTQDVGDRGHLERVAGKRLSGSWDTATWLVSKEDAHREGDMLVIDNPRARTALKQIRGRISHKKGDIFEAMPRKNVPEIKKPTRTQRLARLANIKRARAARWR